MKWLLLSTIAVFTVCPANLKTSDQARPQLRDQPRDGSDDMADA
jgi:hypothetical protein